MNTISKDVLVQYYDLLDARRLDEKALLAFAVENGFIVLKGERAVSNDRATMIGNSYFEECKTLHRVFVKIVAQRLYCDIHLDLLPLNLPVAAIADQEFGGAFTDYFNRIKSVHMEWVEKLKGTRVRTNKMTLELGDWTVIHHIPIDQAVFFARDLFLATQNWVNAWPKQSLSTTSQ